MKPERRTMMLLSVALAVLVALPVQAAWHPRRADQVKAESLVWLATKTTDAAGRAKAEAVWAGVASDATEDDVFVRLVQTFALGEARAARLLAMCSSPRNQTTPPAEAWLRGGDVPPLVANNLRLFYARWLVQESLYEEAQEQLVGIEPNDVAAPASLLFQQGVIAHALLNKDAGLKAIDALLDGAGQSPRRYVAVAKLMREDLKGLKDDTLDHIARRMDDIRRRLDLGRAGSKVRGEQDGVIKSLDKLIKNIEKQQQEQQQHQQQAGRQSSKPAKDSVPMGGKGPGEVTKKNIGSESGWGNLPPKEREQAMQQIGRDFPSHYRDAIEQYFRRLAAEEGEDK